MTSLLFLFNIDLFYNLIIFILNLHCVNIFFREKQNKYRKTKIRSHLIDEQEFGETHVNILKFVEANESDDLEKQNSNKEEGQVAQGGEQAKAEDLKETKKERDEERDNNVDVDMEKSEKSSNISGMFHFSLKIKYLLRVIKIFL